MSVRRLASIPGFNIDRVAAAAGNEKNEEQQLLLHDYGRQL